MSTADRSTAGAGPYGDPETRGRILDAAWELLGSRGAATTLRDIAAAADVSRQSLYLHFGDRSGLLVALVEHIDISLGSPDLRAHVLGAPTGADSLRRWVETMSWYTAKINTITQVLEYHQYSDEAIGAAWRDRMTRRRNEIIASIVRRISSDGDLAPGWTQKTAGDMIHGITMPFLWRELTLELGWSEKAYAKHVSGLLERALLAPRRT